MAKLPKTKDELNLFFQLIHWCSYMLFSPDHEKDYEEYTFMLTDRNDPGWWAHIKRCDTKGYAYSVAECVTCESHLDFPWGNESMHLFRGSGKVAHFVLEQFQGRDLQWELK